MSAEHIQSKDRIVPFNGLYRIDVFDLDSNPLWISWISAVDIHFFRSETHASLIHRNYTYEYSIAAINYSGCAHDL